MARRQARQALGFPASHLHDSHNTILHREVQAQPATFSFFYRASEFHAADTHFIQGEAVTRNTLQVKAVPLPSAFKSRPQLVVQTLLGRKAAGEEVPRESVVTLPGSRFFLPKSIASQSVDARNAERDVLIPQGVCCCFDDA